MISLRKVFLKGTEVDNVRAIVPVIGYTIMYPMFLNIPIVSWLLAFRYPIAFRLTIIEGPLVMLISGFLIRVGFFSLRATSSGISWGGSVADRWWKNMGTS